MPKEVSQMIHDLMKILERELGQPLPDGTQHRVEAQLCQQYGGERVYVPKLPKLVRSVELARHGTGLKSGELSTRARIPLRTVQRLRSGR